MKSLANGNHGKPVETETFDGDRFHLSRFTMFDDYSPRDETAFQFTAHISDPRIKTALCVVPSLRKSNS